MHKKLAADLTSLAHSILQMKNKEDVVALKEKAYAVYEKLAVLAYVEEYINSTPNPTYTKEAIIEKIAAADIEKEMEETGTSTEPEMENIKAQGKTLEQQNSEEHLDKPDIKVQNEDEKSTDDLFTEEKSKKNDEKKPSENKKSSLEDELEDTIPVDVVADLFENVAKKSLNDALQGDIQIGLNDRIAFVKNLFDGSQEDFNRIVSQLNIIKTEKEAKRFINKVVKPDYDWTDKEEFEERFISIVERKFL
ncbi:MAG: hypothetical protein GKR88_10565 [Flavobacteriaceae bacterium]|nr:MAG: hypothetical protein GKR88_10565 [Flavobacteriaceae bacterium]